MKMCIRDRYSLMLYSLLFFPIDMSLLSHASSLMVRRVRLLTIVAFIGWSVPSVAFHSFATPTLSKSAVNSVALLDVYKRQGLNGMTGMEIWSGRTVTK